MNRAYYYLIISAIIVYLMRLIPMVLVRTPIKNSFIRSFLYYVPYITLSIMTFPAIIQATQHPLAGLLALMIAIFLSLRSASLFQVALSACFVVFIIELLLI